jgi:hypothetical protein
MEAGFAPGVLYYLTLWFPTSYPRAHHVDAVPGLRVLAGLFGAPVSGLDARAHGTAWLGMRGMALAVHAGRPAVRRARAGGAEPAEGPHRGRRLAVRAIEKALSEAASFAAERAATRRPFAASSAIKTPGFLTLGLVYFLIQVASYGLNFWAPHLIRSAGTQQPDDHRPADRRAVRLRGDLHGGGGAHVG